MDRVGTTNESISRGTMSLTTCSGLRSVLDDTSLIMASFRSLAYRHSGRSGLLGSLAFSLRKLESSASFSDDSSLVGSDSIYRISRSILSLLNFDIVFPWTSGEQKCSTPMLHP